VHIESVVEQGFSYEFAFDNKALKTLLEFKSVENVQSSNIVECELCIMHENFIAPLLNNRQFTVEDHLV